MSKRVIVLTGVTSGLGKEILSLLDSGENIVFAGYRNKDLLANYSENVFPFYIDLRDAQSIVNASEYILSKIDKIDVMINVAGSVVAGPIEKIDINKLKEQFDVNTFSHLRFMQYLVGKLENGRIINISSMSSFGHYPFISPYCASKRSLDILFNAFSLENHKNIKVISIKPGVIATPIWKKSVKNNRDLIENCGEYYTEMEFLKNNAISNTNKGLDVNKVAKLVKKVAEINNPKSSYTIGFDAKLSELLTLFPQDFINKLVKFALKIRIDL